MSNTDEALERKLVLDFYQKNLYKRARGHAVCEKGFPSNTRHKGRLVSGKIVDLAYYTENSKKNWTVVIEEYPPGIKHLVVFSSVQLLDNLNQPVQADEPYGKMYYGKQITVTANDADTVANLHKLAETWKEEAVKAKALCHSECTDGYCHRAYEAGIIRAKGL